jgi:Fe2+ or Zn2+ uptake regulation protein
MTGDVHGVVERRLRRADQRYTAGRRAIVDLLVRRVAASDEFARFELAEDLTEHHHHLICLNCGKVTDVTLSRGLEQDITEAISQLAGAARFQPRTHRLDIMGTCADCQ